LNNFSVFSILSVDKIFYCHTQRT